MTLTLEEVRQTRFHLARRNGYEPADVDTFVDKVEVTISQLSEENVTLKKQVDALRNTQPEGIFAAPDGSGDGESGDIAAARQRAEELSAQVEELTRKNEELRAELEAVKAQSGSDSEQTAETPAVGSMAERIVVTTSAEASPAVVRLVQLATEQAEQVVAEAQAEATQKVEEANKKSHETLTDARTRAERMESEARINAEQIRTSARTAAEQATSEAQERANLLDSETAEKRVELFAQLESERDDLLGRVDHLRNFESSYRDNLTQHLQAQLAAVSSVSTEPQDVPSLVTDPRPESQSQTPRLDALLAQNQTED